MYLVYVKEFGIWLFVLFLVFLLLITAGLEALSHCWLAAWSSEEQPSPNRVLIYGLIGVLKCSWKLSGIVSATSLCISWSLVVYGAYRASKNVHAEMLASVLRAPMAFFETTPLGQILTRFSKVCSLYSTFRTFNKSTRAFLGATNSAP